MGQYFYINYGQDLCSTELLLILNKLQSFPSNIHVDQKDSWQDGRNTLEQLIQCFHEANAYNNVVGNKNDRMEY